MSPLSTEQVAAKLGIHRTTLELWIRQRKIKPKAVYVGKKAFRLWTEREIEKLRRIKERTYRKGRGRKKKPKY